MCLNASFVTMLFLCLNASFVTMLFFCLNVSFVSMLFLCLNVSMTQRLAQFVTGYTLNKFKHYYYFSTKLDMH